MALPTSDYTTRTYDSADFFPALLGGTATMGFSQPTNAGVSPANINTNKYKVDGNTMHLAIDALDGIVTGNATQRANNFIGMKLPAGMWGGFTCQIPCLASVDGGAWQLVYCIVTEWNPNVYFRLASGADWPVTSHLRLNANLVIEVVDPGEYS